MLAQSGGVLEGQSLIFAINPGFYKEDNVSLVASSPYTGAVQYMVAAASTTQAWSGSDGLVATITFQITKQPQGSSGESTVTLALENAYTALTDGDANDVPQASVSGSLTIDATPSQQYYALTVNVVGSGSVTKNPSSATYLSGTSVALTATPVVGWVFDHWSGDLSGSQNPASVTMSANKTVTATFVVSTGQQYYALTVNVVGSGSVTKNPSSATYLSGTSVALTANPAVGWMFHHWSGDATGGQNQINVTMDGNKMVNVTFAILGDLNNDGKVNLQDFTQFASWYNMGSSNPKWNVSVLPWCAPSAADFCKVGKLKLQNLVTLAVFYSVSPH
jgi:hypothetical protein